MNIYPVLDTAAKSLLFLSFQGSAMHWHLEDVTTVTTNQQSLHPFSPPSHISFCFSWLTGRLEGRRYRHIEMHKKNRVSYPNLYYPKSPHVSSSHLPCHETPCSNEPSIVQMVSWSELILETWSRVTLRCHFISHMECRGYKVSVSHFTFYPRL